MLKIEKTEVTTTKGDYELVLWQRGLFGWRQESFEGYGDNYEVLFTREPNIPNLKRIRELELAYPFGRPPEVTTFNQGGLYEFLFILGACGVLGGPVGTVINLPELWGVGKGGSMWNSLEDCFKLLLVGLGMIAVAFIWQKLQEAWVRSEINDARRFVSRQKQIESILLQEKLIDQQYLRLGQNRP